MTVSVPDNGCFDHVCTVMFTVKRLLPSSDNGCTGQSVPPAPPALIKCVVGTACRMAALPPGTMLSLSELESQLDQQLSFNGWGDLGAECATGAGAGPAGGAAASPQRCNIRRWRPASSA